MSQLPSINALRINNLQSDEALHDALSMLNKKVVNADRNIQSLSQNLWEKTPLQKLLGEVKKPADMMTMRENFRS